MESEWAFEYGGVKLSTKVGDSDEDNKPKLLIIST